VKGMTHRSYITYYCCICVFFRLFQYFNQLFFAFNRLIISVSTSFVFSISILFLQCLYTLSDALIVSIFDALMKILLFPK